MTWESSEKRGEGKGGSRKEEATAFKGMEEVVGNCARRCEKKTGRKIERKDFHYSI